MAQQLKNIVAFSVGAGLTVQHPHGLHNENVPLIPDFVEPDDLSTGAEITADATNISVHNPTGSTIAINVLAEAWHTIERAFGDTVNMALSPQPFVPHAAAGGGGSALFPVGPIVELGSGGSTNLVASLINMIDATNNSPGGGTAHLPLASSVPNGTWCSLKLTSTDSETHPDGTGLPIPIQVAVQPGDTLDYDTGTLSMAAVGSCITFVSDGVSNWVYAWEVFFAPS